MVDAVSIPPSGKAKPLARLNLLYHAGGRSDRLFVADMRGKIYALKHGCVLPTPFSDVAAVRQEHFFTQDSLNETGLSSFAVHPDFPRLGRPGYSKLYTVHSERPNDPRGFPPSNIFNSPIAPVRHVQVLTEWHVDPQIPDRVMPRSRR